MGKKVFLVVILIALIGAIGWKLKSSSSASTSSAPSSEQTSSGEETNPNAAKTTVNILPAAN